MKKLACFIAATVVAFAVAVPAAAQVKFGLKAGVAINSLKFDESALNTDNRAGFTGGVMLEFTVPVLGVGFDASAMYVHRTTNSDILTDNGSKVDLSRDYIDIPLNVKWKINVPAVNKIIRPYLTTGPSFAFLVSKKDVENFIKNKSCDIAWNFGFGVELFSHLQVGASYGIGLTKTLETIKIVDDNMPTIEGKNKYWTVTAAYLF